ncbi:MAG: glycosyltransferase family 2 protein [Rhizomicrobium sp.]
MPPAIPVTFSIIIPTRNRPSLFANALASVLAQTCEEIEIVVVNDGSDETHTASYEAVIGSACRAVRYYTLPRRPQGHGTSYARNFGVAHVRGSYLCFLDDDDWWTDPEYLERVRGIVLRREGQVDLHLSNQAAFLHDTRKMGPIWIEALADQLKTAARMPQDDGVYAVTVMDLLGCGGFCNLNTLTVRRELFEDVGALDESIRWEMDHDLNLRLLDRAGSILYAPQFVARHNIPDPAKTDNVTTALSEIGRRLDQLRVFDKAAIYAAHPAIRAYGRRHRGYTLKRIAESLAARQDFVTAYYYARMALGALPTAKWAAYTAVLATRAAFQRRDRRT